MQEFAEDVNALHALSSRQDLLCSRKLEALAEVEAHTLEVQRRSCGQAAGALSVEESTDRDGQVHAARRSKISKLRQDITEIETDIVKLIPQQSAAQALLRAVEERAAGCDSESDGTDVALSESEVAAKEIDAATLQSEIDRQAEQLSRLRQSTMRSTLGSHSVLLLHRLRFHAADAEQYLVALNEVSTRM